MFGDATNRFQIILFYHVSDKVNLFLSSFFSSFLVLLFPPILLSCSFIVSAELEKNDGSNKKGGPGNNLIK